MHRYTVAQHGIVATVNQMDWQGRIAGIPRQKAELVFGGKSPGVEVFQ